MDKRISIVRRMRFGLPALALAFGAAGAVVHPAAGAAILTVNSLADTDLDSDGLCTLREAITAANNDENYHDCASTNFGDDTITFSVDGTITLTSSLPTPVYQSNLTIDGSGRNVVISGNSLYRIISVGHGAQLSLRSLTVTNGRADNGGGVQSGGILAIEDCIFSGNQATGRGGAIHSQGELTITRSVFSGNTSGDAGGGIVNQGGELAVYESAFTLNSTLHGGGAILTVTTTGVILSGSTFHDNSSTSGGGGLEVYSGSVSIVTSTFAGNVGGLYSGALMVGLGAGADVLNSTFSGNSRALATHDAVTVTNSILAASTDENCYFLEEGAAVNGGNNIDSGATCGWGSANGSVSSTDPLLGLLQDNGGSTLTMALQPGSPAIDGVTWNVPNGCPVHDQRGIVRPGARCDIGAYELTAGYLVLLPFAAKS